MSTTSIKNIVMNLLITTVSFMKIIKNGITRCPLPHISIDKTEIYLLGNGPSLNNNLDNVKKTLQSNDCMCVNNFAESDLFAVIKPGYYILLDPNFWRADCLKGVTEAREHLYETINRKTEWCMTLLVPIAAKKHLDWENIFIQNKNIKIYFFNSTPLAGYKSVIHRLYKYNMGMPHPQNVLVAAIFTAINMGYKNIYLLGADHSWHEDLVLNNDNVVCLRNKHFYDEETVKLVPWKKGDNGETTWKMHEILTALAKMFEGYQHLEEYSRYRGVNIINASVKTSIDAFTRYQFH
ncbi:MAG: DUF115 domain-containing protein [Desulfuromonadaceae bacterium]|nr:DUF115 domain-containing protein [Desulfuromonadaceae bacterium]MDD2855504.1 DUF115 domain-containing protein [Desulfuromonadaceae bacterium]